MKFKYYLRGAGIGIIVTTVILSAASLFQDNMSDAEVIQRAMELGMVMEEGQGSTLADIPNQGNTDPDTNTALDDNQSADDGSQPNTSDDGQNPPSDSSDNSQGTKPIGNTETPGDTGDGAAQPDSSPEDANEPNKDSGTQGDNTGQDKVPEKDGDGKKENNDKEKITIKIEGGEVSRAISQKVFEAGLVDDAEEFNSYLGDNGYASFLQPGTYHIKKGASFQQIAEMLTRK